MESSSLTISLFVKALNRPGSRDHCYQSKHIEMHPHHPFMQPTVARELSD
jgi:hypothetical protein